MTIRIPIIARKKPLNVFHHRSEHFISFGEMGIGENKKAVIYEQPEQKEINALKYEQQLFVEAIIKDETPVVSGKDGLQALKVAEMIIQKIEESKMHSLQKNDFDYSKKFLHVSHFKKDKSHSSISSNFNPSLWVIYYFYQVLAPGFPGPKIYLV